MDLKDVVRLIRMHLKHLASQAERARARKDEWRLGYYEGAQSEAMAILESVKRMSKEAS